LRPIRLSVCLSHYLCFRLSTNKAALESQQEAQLLAVVVIADRTAYDIAADRSLE